MRFKLTLGFGGLCLFVPELDGEKRPVKMHVLMPSHGHRALLAFDEKATGTSRPTGRPGVPISLEGCQLDLTQLKAGSGLDPAPPGVADLEGVCRPVATELLTPNYPGNKIVSRVSFNTGRSRIADCSAGAIWHYRGKPQQLAIRVVWEIDVDESELAITVTSLKDSSVVQTFTLHPYDQKLELWILHLAAEEILEEIPPRTSNERNQKSGEYARHFHAFFDLLGGCTINLPGYAGSEIDPNIPLPPCYYKPHHGLDVMCIAAKAPLAP